MHKGLGCSLENHPGLLHYPNELINVAIIVLSWRIWSEAVCSCLFTTTLLVQWANVFTWMLLYCPFTKKNCFLVYLFKKNVIAVLWGKFYLLLLSKNELKTVVKTYFEFFFSQFRHVARFSNSVGIRWTVVFAIKTGVLRALLNCLRQTPRCRSCIFPAKERSIGIEARGVSVAVSKGSRKIKDKGRKIAPQCRRLLVLVSLGYY